MTYKESRYSCMNEIKGYVIRKTYIDGAFKGKSYILIRSGFVRPDTPKDIRNIMKEDTYKTERAAKIAKATYKRNDYSNITEYELVEVK